ncbi:MAG: hypothetical protein QM688_15270, partial [Sphingomonas bacterium]
PTLLPDPASPHNRLARIRALAPERKPAVEADSQDVIASLTREVQALETMLAAPRDASMH